MFQFFRVGSTSKAAAILYIILGLMLIIFPGISGTVFCWGLAVAALGIAALRLSQYFRSKRDGYGNSGDLIVGIIFAFLGLICLLRADLVLSLLPLTLGIVLLVSGIFKIPAAVEMYQNRVPSYIPILVSCLIPLVLGIILISNPFGAAKGVITFFGISLIIGGVSDLGAAKASGG